MSQKSIIECDACNTTITVRNEDLCDDTGLPSGWAAVQIGTIDKAADEEDSDEYTICPECVAKLELPKSPLVDVEADKE